MIRSFVPAAALLIFSVLAVLGALGKLDSSMQRCIDSGKVWVGGKGSCHACYPAVEAALRENSALARQSEN